jgi:hypothetical protein
VEAAVNEPRVAIVGAGAVTALGLGLEPLRQALQTNAGGLRPRECVIGKIRQPVIAGWVPEATVEQLRSDGSLSKLAFGSPSFSSPSPRDEGAGRPGLRRAEVASATQAGRGASQPSVTGTSSPRPSPPLRGGEGEETAGGSRAFLFASAALRQAAQSLPHPGLLHSVPPSRRGLVLSTTKADIEALETLLKARSRRLQEAPSSPSQPSTLNSQPPSPNPTR